MDIISSDQLQSYEEILEQINSEYEKSEKLKQEIEKENSKILALKLSSLKCKQKISHVFVKVFNNVSEIYNLYDDEIKHCNLELLSKHENCKFYLVEVILTKCLLEKFLDSEWRLNINICLGNSRISTVVSLQSSSIFEIIPINADVKECTVETCLFSLTGGTWNVIDLHSVDIDISYHFESRKRRHRQKSIHEKLMSLLSLYPTHLNSDLGNKQVFVEFLCDHEKYDFVKGILKNSYHRMDLESFSELCSDNKQVVDLQFYVCNRKVLISYNKPSKLLKISCSSEDMLLLKKFFLNFSTANYETIKDKVKKLKKKVVDSVTLNEIIALHKDTRRLWM